MFCDWSLQRLRTSNCRDRQPFHYIVQIPAGDVGSSCWLCTGSGATVSSLVPIRNHPISMAPGSGCCSTWWLRSLPRKHPQSRWRASRYRFLKQTSLKGGAYLEGIRNNYPRNHPKPLKQSNSSRVRMGSFKNQVHFRCASDWQVNAEDYDGPYQLLGTKAHCCNWTQGMPVHMGAWILDDVDINTSLTLHRVMLLCGCRGGFAMAMHQQISFL